MSDELASPSLPYQEDAEEATCDTKALSPPRPRPSAVTPPHIPAPLVTLSPPPDIGALASLGCCCRAGCVNHRASWRFAALASRVIRVWVPLCLVFGSIVAATTVMLQARGWEAQEWDVAMRWSIGSILVCWGFAFFLAAYWHAFVPVRGRLTYDRPNYYVTLQIPRSAVGISAAVLMLVSPYIHTALLSSVAPKWSWLRALSLESAAVQQCSTSMALFWTLWVFGIVLSVAAVVAVTAHRGCIEAPVTIKDTLRWWRAPVLMSCAFCSAIPIAVRLLRATRCIPVQSTSASRVNYSAAICDQYACGSDGHILFIVFAVVGVFVMSLFLVLLHWRLHILNPEDAFATVEQNCVKLDPATCGMQLITTVVLVAIASMNASGIIATFVVCLLMLGSLLVAFTAIPSSAYAISLLVRWGCTVDMVTAATLLSSTAAQDISPSAATPTLDITLLTTWVAGVSLSTAVFFRQWLKGTGCKPKCVDSGDSSMPNFTDIAL